MSRIKFISGHFFHFKLELRKRIFESFSWLERKWGWTLKRDFSSKFQTFRPNLTFSVFEIFPETSENFLFSESGENSERRKLCFRLLHDHLRRVHFDDHDDARWWRHRRVFEPNSGWKLPFFFFEWQKCFETLTPTRQNLDWPFSFLNMRNNIRPSMAANDLTRPSPASRRSETST